MGNFLTRIIHAKCNLMYFQIGWTVNKGKWHCCCPFIFTFELQIVFTKLIFHKL